jgi:hypothetical protein
MFCGRFFDGRSEEAQFEEMVFWEEEVDVGDSEIG